MAPTKVYHVFPFKAEYEGECSWKDFMDIEDKVSKDDPSITKYTTFRGKLLLGRSLKFKKELIVISDKNNKEIPIDEIIFWSYFDNESPHPLKDELMKPIYNEYVDQKSSIFNSKKFVKNDNYDFILEMSECFRFKLRD
uniref:DM10 domain-containing protein n=1 Tax=Parastrongyloides trichosuri TaxID=131310 RepID=A0A0N4ZQN2_PARTI